MPMRILTVIGTRPQYVKAAMVSRALSLLPGCREMLIDTGQHYDRTMSAVFLEQMNIPLPVVNLGLGGGGHGEMTGRMLAALEKEMLARAPDLVLVYGDTNSTLAGALAAAKLNIPVAHVEAGIRSFNRRMPEETNRVLCDRLATLLFCPTFSSVELLAKEGIRDGVFHVGDVMYDAARHFFGEAMRSSSILTTLGVREKHFFLATIHRPENTGNRERLGGILAGLSRLGREEAPVVLPVHPRLANRLPEFIPGIVRCEPVPYFDMVRLEAAARAIVTDSGGVQKEAYFHGTPCVTVREETEWPETVSSGWNALAGSDPDTIVLLAREASPGRPIPDFGDGNASGRIAEILLGFGAGERACGFG